MIDLIAGQIDLMVDQVQNSLAHVRAGTIKAYAIASPTRVAAGARHADRRRGRRAGTVHVAVVRLLGAGRHARADRRQAQRRGAWTRSADPAVRERLTGLGMEIPPREQQTPEALRAQQKADIEKWWPIIKAAGIKQQ